jgi:selenide,water dikinase
MEDAALLRPENGSPLVFTVDFITPIVDSPEDFGAIAAANSISDVYSMGGEPQVALALCGFPEDRVSSEIVARIFQGGRDKAAEASCAIVGGHTVLDPELKYGLCVIGTVDADRALTQTRGRVGDRLALTKPIGFGIAAQALKKDRLESAEIERLVALLKTLNKGAKDAALRADARAATDVTGFGLLGHLRNLALGSGCAARLFAGAVPVLDFVRPLAEQGLVPGGSRKNLSFVEPTTRFEAAVDPVERLLLADAQTSGGLLIAIPPDGEATLLTALEEEGTPARAIVGELIAGEPGHLEVVAGLPR